MYISRKPSMGHFAHYPHACGQSHTPQTHERHAQTSNQIRIHTHTGTTSPASSITDFSRANRAFWRRCSRLPCTWHDMRLLITGVDKCMRNWCSGKNRRAVRLNIDTDWKRSCETRNKRQFNYWNMTFKVTTLSLKHRGSHAFKKCKPKLALVDIAKSNRCRKNIKLPAHRQWSTTDIHLS